MKDYRLSPKAEVDLDNIWSYTATTRSPEQADRYISGLFDAFITITDNPALGAPADDILPGYRRLRRGYHLIFYRMIGRDQVEVVRVLHESSNIPQHLRDA